MPSPHTPAAAVAAEELVAQDLPQRLGERAWWRIERRTGLRPVGGTLASTIRDREPAPPATGALADVPFHPTGRPSPTSVPVDQVIVTSAALADAFQALADRQTRRGIPTVVRTLDWIDAEYPGADAPARIRTFLRDAYDQWGTSYAVLGGDATVVPTRYVRWDTESIPSDLYFECLDREWNEDGDGIFGEPYNGAGTENCVQDVAVGPDDVIWAATFAGLARRDGEVFTHFDTGDGLPSDAVYAVALDAAGTVWVGTDAGVARRDGAGWIAWDGADGLPGSLVTCVAPAAADDVWIGTDAGLAHFDGSAWTALGVADGLPGAFDTDVCRVGDVLWVGTYAGAASVEDGSVTVHDVAGAGILSDWVTAVDVDPAGRVWLGHPDHDYAAGGFSVLDGGAWSVDPLPAFGGLSPNGLAFGPGTDEVWAATVEGLFHRSAAGDELLGPADGLPGEVTYAVARGAGFTLATGGADGLAVGTSGAWAIYTQDNGLPSVLGDDDDIDLHPELVVGRIPVVSAAQVEAYVAKLAAYESGAVTDHLDRALFLGEVLNPGETGKETCRDILPLFPPTLTPTELYETDGQLTAASAQAALDEGAAITVQVCHGSYDVLGAGPGLELLFNADLDALAPTGHTGFHVLYACNAGGFDHDSSMEHLLLHPTAGAVATMAGTRAALVAVDAGFTRDYFANLFASPHGNPARTLVETRRSELAERELDFATGSWHRHMYLSRSFLGSPTLSVWRGTPTALAVSHPPAIPAQRAPFPVVVTVAATGAPVADALVCVSKGDEDYARGRTDATGTVTFDFRPESAGTVDVVVTAPDHLAYEGTATVATASGPNPVAAGWQRQPERHPDDLWTIVLGLRNAGLATESGWSVQLTCDDPRVTVMAGTGVLPALAAGVTDWTTPLTFRVAPEVGDGEQLQLLLTGNGPTAFAEIFTLPVTAPALAPAGFVVVGQAVYPRVTNTGSAATGDLTATLTALTPGATVLDDDASGVSLAPGETGVLADGFFVDAAPDAIFELTVQCADGRALVRRVDVAAPAQPDAAWSEPRDGGARLAWNPSPATDIAGYRVLAAGPAGWEDAFGTLVTQGALAEVAFPAGTSRDFAIVAVDSSGNESPDSCFVTAHAAWPLLPGWPRHIGAKVGPSALLAVDLDANGSLEVLLGSMWESNAAHVFLADGSEWTDGDENPKTHGVFGKTGGRVVAAPLAVDVDDDGLLEIFAGSYDGSVHAWRVDGTPGVAPPALAGWPVAHGAAGSRTTPVAGDLDGDGAPEIVTMGNDGLVRALEADGTALPGWPRATGGTSLGSTPALADLDGDGREDVVFGATDSTLYAVSGHGTDLPGWPRSVGAKILASPVLADVDGDGDLEIFVFDRNGTFWAYHHDATPLPGWPVALTPITVNPPSPAVADLDDDGVPELVVNGNGEIVVLKADGTAFPGWPLATGVPGTNSPVIADLDGDGGLDILVGSADQLLTAYRLDGTILPGWPWRCLELPNATPAVADVDGDGDLDVCLGADDGWVRVVDAPGPAVPGAAPWPAYHGGADQRGVYVPAGDEPGTGVGPLPPLAPAATELALLPPAPNPSRGATALRFTLPNAGRVWVDIHDVTGRRVVSLAQGEQLPAGPHALVWDGRDSAGLTAGAGVYFTRLRAEDRVLTGKILRLR